MSKKIIQENERRKSVNEQRSLEAGDRFRLSWRMGLYSNCLYFSTEELAQEKRDSMLKENAIKIPMDYYERQATLTNLEIEIYEHDGVLWRLITGSQRSCTTDVRYHD